MEYKPSLQFASFFHRKEIHKREHAKDKTRCLATAVICPLGMWVRGMDGYRINAFTPHLLPVSIYMLFPTVLSRFFCVYRVQVKCSMLWMHKPVWSSSNWKRPSYHPIAASLFACSFFLKNTSCILFWWTKETTWSHDSLLNFQFCLLEDKLTIVGLLLSWLPWSIGNCFVLLFVPDFFRYQFCDSQYVYKHMLCLLTPIKWSPWREQDR